VQIARLQLHELDSVLGVVWVDQSPGNNGVEVDPMSTRYIIFVVSFLVVVEISKYIFQATFCVAHDSVHEVRVLVQAAHAPVKVLAVQPVILPGLRSH
jgi:hypothetical protein